MTRAPFRIVFRIFALLSVSILVCPDEAVAQGRGRGPGGLLRVLGQDGLRERLALNSEQRDRMREIETAASGGPVFDPYIEKLNTAESEEEKTAIRNEMSEKAAELQEQADSQVRSLLTAEQAKEIAQYLIREQGESAVGEPLVQSYLGLSEAQATAISDLQTERSEAFRSVGRVSPEDFQSLREEWNQKLLAVLEPSQLENWKSTAGETGTSEAGGAPRSTSGPVASTTAEGIPAPAEQENAATDPNGVAASFQTTSNAADSAVGDDQEKRLLSFNFRYAPWSEVLVLFADYANLTLDLNETPPGTFNYYDTRKFTPTEALDVLNGYLLQKGYILVQRDNFLVCLNLDDGIPPNLVPNITADELPKRGENELLNVVFPIKDVPAATVAKEVELLTGPQGKVVPLSTSNSLVVTDIGSNLRRIGSLLSAISAVGPTEQVFKSYVLKHLDPRDAEATIKVQLGLEAGVRNVSAAYESWSRDRDRDRSRDSRSPTPAPTAPPSSPKVAADSRTNSVLVTATAAQHRIVEEVLKSTDIPAAAGAAERSRSNEPYLKVYKLRQSDPQEVVKTLDVLMPGVVINEDGRNRLIHVNAPQAVQDEVEQLLRQLDGEGTRSGSAVTVISLAQLDPYSAAATIRSLFSGDGDDAPVVEADSFGRRLLVRGTEDQVAQVKILLSQLGEDGSVTVGDRIGSGPVRTVPLGGRDPDELIPLLQRLWETSSDDTPLRVLPTSPSTIIERRPLGQTSTPSARRSIAIEAINASERPAANYNVVDPVPVGDQAGDAGVDGSEEEESAVEAEQEPNEVAPGANPPAVEANQPPVALSVQGGNLMLVSEDEKALNRLEDLIGQLGQVIPPRTKWSVFYLRSADATETAMLLEQLFPSSSVSMTSVDGGLFGGLTSGLSSFGGSLVDAAGLDTFGMDTQTLRIIPDLRSNALFVTGPPGKVAEVEQFLNVLDETDLPDSLRDRLPRMIDVKYADVEEVAEIVREVYKDYLQPANAAAMGNNPLAMMLMGGGGGSSGRGDRDRRDQPQGAIRLTVGVDKTTSKLIVSADEALFRQIEQLVASLDDAQLQAKRTVRVISLENADATLVQNTLGSLIPKVRTSSTTERRSSTNGSSSSSNSNSTPSSSPSPSSSGPSREDQERIQRFMEMRARMGGGDSSSGRPSFGGFGGDRGSFGGDRGSSGGDRGSSRDSSRRGR